MNEGMGLRFNYMTENDRLPVIDIYNYFIMKSYAAYPAETVDYNYFDYFLQIIGDYPAYTLKMTNDDIIGFAFLHPYRPINTFYETAEITYFILPEYTRAGAGSVILEQLITDANKRGIKKILASISSLNEQSIQFHKKHNFIECGRLPGIGKKFSNYFDVVYMIRDLTL
jgi:phosphinothricin acetyltransferase